MATIISNQATVSYRYRENTATAVSNTASAVLNTSLEIEKNSLSDTYRIGDNISYIVTVINNGNRIIEDILVTDDLGTYTLDDDEVTPLTFIGPARLFINGEFSATLSPIITERSVIFDIPFIPAGGNAQIFYLARVNEYADPGTGGEITNTATAVVEDGCFCCQSVSDSYTITAEEFADIRVVKSICPNPINCDEDITYTIDIYNYGNLEADDIVLNDTFNPILNDISITLDGVDVSEDDFSYIGGVLRLPSEDSELSISVPAATFTQNHENGLYTTTPGHIRIVITGAL